MEKPVGDRVILFHSVQGMKLDEHLFFWAENQWNFFFFFALPLCGSNFYKESKLDILSTKSQYQKTKNAIDTQK